MPRRQKQLTCLSSGLLVLAALATGGMSAAPFQEPLRMSNLKVQGLAGFEVVDVKGVRIGEIIQIDTDDRGRARWLRVDLDAGGEIRLASFRATLDARRETIMLQLPEDIVVRRAEPETLSSLSA
jgi:hypothetical protein